MNQEQLSERMRDTMQKRTAVRVETVIQARPGPMPEGLFKQPNGSLVGWLGPQPPRSDSRGHRLPAQKVVSTSMPEQPADRLDGPRPPTCFEAIQGTAGVCGVTAPLIPLRPHQGRQGMATPEIVEAQWQMALHYIETDLARVKRQIVALSARDLAEQIAKPTVHPVGQLSDDTA